MNKTLLYAGILAAILALVYFFNGQQKTTTMNIEETAFAFEDTAAITKIRLEASDKRYILLEKKEEDFWRLNTYYSARPDAIKSILNTLRKVKVLHPVSKAAYENVQQMFDKPLRTVQIYTDNADVPTKTYYVGGMKGNKKGTYMKLEGAVNPYVTYIPAVDGHLVSRYFINLEEWRDRTVFQYDNPQRDIAHIEVVYPHTPEQSFQLFNDGKALTIKKLSETTKDLPVEELNEAFATEYLQNFHLLFAEAYQNDYPHQDSIRKSMPYCTIKVTDYRGKQKKAAIHYMPINRRSKKQFEADGTAVPYDLDRYFAFIHKGRDFMIIQQYVFEKIFKQYTDFFKTK